MKKIILLLFLIFVFLYPIPYTLYPVHAQASDLGQSQITPASPLYFLKSVREILELKFAGTARVKSIRELEFATRRIREVNSLVNTSRQDLIEPTLYQYLFHMGEFVGQANLKDPDFAAEASNTVSWQMTDLQTVYSRATNKRALMSIRATINNLSKLELKLTERLNLEGRALPAQEISVSRLSACNFLSKEASSSALNEVEKEVFAKRANDCLKGL